MYTDHRKYWINKLNIHDTSFCVVYKFHTILQKIISRNVRFIRERAFTSLNTLFSLRTFRYFENITVAT